MSKLSVKTKNNSSPQGKPRVYFSCHPADFKKFFETICADIFATQDCAIYYESDWEREADEEELQLNLSDMQMFVMPITTKFLTEDCRARLLEYGYAMEKHIPILPIAVEGGLERVFAEKLNAIKKGYGDVQYLDRTSTDNTQISYAEKLEGRLSSILIGNELAERVRAAFDAYIFLSYRKKDRAMAKELMSLIHRIPFCRDIAIWYDEFLIPGEAWNNAIAEALQKSSLVTLMVTPSIVEPGNFIIEHEYPDAVAAGKEVLPAEVKATDRDALFRLFEGISMPFDACNIEVLTEKLMALAVTNNDSSPEHNYLIGLAYLGAIDVERDYERAVTLITSAAEAGLPEAMEKLADMYNSGEGVERNYYAAAEWMEKCCDAMGGENAGSRKHIMSLQKCSLMWKDLGRLDRARPALEKAVNLCREMDKSVEATTLKSLLAGNYIGLGDVCFLEQKYAEAVFNYERGVELIKDNFSDSLDAKQLLFVSTVYGKIGDIYRVEGRFSEARDCFLKYLIFIEAMADKGFDGAKREMALTYIKLGGVYEAERKMQEAGKYYEAALAIEEQLLAEEGTIIIRDDLINCHIMIGTLYESEGEYDAAINHYMKGLELAKSMVLEIGTLRSRDNLCTCYNALGRIYAQYYVYNPQYSANGMKSREYYNEALRLLKELFEETGMIQYRRDISVVLLGIVETYCADGKYSKADEYCEEALAIREELAKEVGNVLSRQDLIDACTCVGKIYRNEERTSEAIGLFERSIDLAKDLLTEVRTIEARRSLLLAYAELGNCYKDSIDKAIECYEKSLQIAKEIFKEAATVRTCEDVAGAFFTLGSLYTIVKETAKAKQCYEEGIKYTQKVKNENRSEEVKRNLLSAYVILGNIYSSEGNLGEAKSYLTNAMEMAMEYFYKTGDVKYGNMAFEACNRIVNDYISKGRISRAILYAEKSIEIATEEKKTGTNIGYIDFAVAQMQMGLILEKAGEFDKAILHLLQAESMFSVLSDSLGEAVGEADLAKGISECEKAMDRIQKLKK